MIPIASFWKQEADSREKAAIRTVFYNTRYYLDDSFEKGEIKTAVTCDELVKAGYMTKTPKGSIGIENFEIKITQRDGRPCVEYVR